MSDRSLSDHVLTWTLPFVVGVSSLIALSTYLVARTTIVGQLDQGARSQAATASAEVKGLWEQSRNQLLTIAQSPLFRDYFLNLDFELHQEAEIYRQEIERMLGDFSLRSKNAYPRLRLLDLKGRELAVIRSDAVAAPARARDLEAVAAAGPLRPGQSKASRPARVSWHDSLVVSWSAGVFDKQNRLRGLLVFDASFKPIHALLEHFRIGESGRVHIYEWSGKTAAGLAQLAKLGSRVTASAPVTGTPFVVIFSVDREEFIRPLWLIGGATAVLALFAALLLLIGLSRQLRFLLAPIRTLADASRRLASGELEGEVATKGPREVVQLARSFNAMVVSLRQRTSDLVQRVRELTALHRMNEAGMRQLARGAMAKACLEAAVQGLGFERGALLWIVEDRGEIVGECGCGADAPGYSDDEVRRRRLSLDGDDICAEAVHARATVLREEGGRAVCAAPIMVGRSAIAVIIVERELSAAGHRQVKSFSLFCGAAGIVLENARLLEETLASEARYRTAVENSPHAVISLDQNMRITLWNRRAEGLFNYQPSEAAGRTPAFLFRDRDYARLKRQVETEGAVRQAEAQGVTRDGRALELNVSWTGQISARGAREWFVVIQDETEKKRLQAQLIQAEKLSAVGSLIAGVAHELNNPLAAVTGFAELLKDIPAGPEEREDLRQMHLSALRCRDIVQGLLSFVRQGKAIRQRVPLNYLAQATIGLLEYRMVKTEGLALEIDLDQRSPFVAGDFSRLQQILVNLLNNACDALRGRFGRRVIRVRTRVLSDGAQVEVEDNGPGVPAEIRAKLFAPFVTSKPVGVGTGLGLSISSQIAADFDAVLRYEDAPAGGARFVLRFPACPEGLQEADSSLNLPPPCPGARVLIIDDEPEMAQLMTRLLSEDGMVTRAVTSVEGARRAMEDEAFEIVVSDVDLGPDKGFDLLDLAGAGSRRPSFLFVTGDVLNFQLNREAAQRGVPVLAKPFLRTDFLRAVRRLIHEFRRPARA